MVSAAQFMEKKVLTLAAARKMVTAAEAEAKRQHLAEDGGWPILIERMDHAAYVASVELARRIRFSDTASSRSGQ
jgi:glc operon protein GlcG